MVTKRSRVAFCGLALALFAAGCSMGPDFSAPAPEGSDHYLRRLSDVQDLQTPEDAPPDPKWWALFHDPVLDQLVAKVVSQNLDVLTATERIGESRAQVGITAADLFPQVEGDASYTREKLSDKGVIGLLGSSSGSSGAAPVSASGAGPGAAQGPQSMGASPPFNVYQYGFDVSWELDLWGRVRRGVEAAKADQEAQEDARRAALISSIAEMVRDYAQLRGSQMIYATTRRNMEAAQEIAGLTQERQKAGLSSDLDVANAKAQAASDEAQLPQLEQQISQLMNAIALLLAEPPGALENELGELRPLQPLPTRVPIGLPSQLAERRPDVRQAIDQLHEATAEIGVAKADFFPRVTLMGDGMLQSLHFNTLNDWAARGYSFGPSVTLPIFEGGRLVSTLDLREASQREAALQFRKTVLTAFHEVDNALTAFRAEQRRAAALSVAVDQTGTALSLSVDLYKKGLGDFLSVLTAEQNALTAQQQQVQSEETAITNMVQLYKALGGGWEVDFPTR